MNITANLFIQHGLYYVILSYRDSNNKRKQKWIPTGISEKGNNKRLANQKLDEIKQNYKDYLPTESTFETDEAEKYLRKLKSILEYIDLIKKAKFVITNDTGIYHIAVVSEVPVCITAGAYTYDRYLTYNFKGKEKYKRPYIACKKMKCANCDNRCIKSNELNKTWPCLDEVTVEDAWKQIKDMIKDLEK